MRHIFSSFMICLSLCCAHTSVALAAQDGKQPAASDPWQDASVTHKPHADDRSLLAFYK